MNNSVLIITDEDKGVDFSLLSSFYKLSLIKKTDVSEALVLANKLVILDLKSPGELKTLLSKIRTMAPNKSILIIQAFDFKNNHDLLKNSIGFGQLRILNYRREYPEQLVENVNKLMHPEYPVGASDIAIIMPVYNEETRFINVLNFYEKITKLCEESFVNATVYFVNDGSKDRTQELIDQIIKKVNDDTQTISNIAFANAQQLQANTRKAGTYIEGIKSIRADILLFVDADDSFRIDDIAKMINIIREGYYELVVGTKDMTAENRPPLRKLMSFGKRQLTKTLLPEGVYDSQTGLKAMNAISANHILPHLNVTTGLAIDLEILNIAKKYRLRTLQIPVECIDQEGSHVDIIKDSISFIKNIVKIHRRNKDIKVNGIK